MTMKIVFMGTPDFAVPSLEEIIKRYEVKAVFTQPDKPKGRGQKVKATPVKEVALKHNISVYQPIKLRNDEESINILKEIAPDLIIVIAYGQILPAKVLEIPKLGCVNLHGSLLPKLRGAAPINWSIINGQMVTGNTTMLMGVGLDTGDMLLRTETEIGQNETAGELYERLSVLGVPLIIETIEKIGSNSITPIKQKDELSSYAPMLNKEAGRINWNLDAEKVYNHIRGVTPWPGAYTFYNDKMIKISKAIKGSSLIPRANCGQILDVLKSGIEIACSEGSIIVKEVQELGGKQMEIMAYLNGHNVNKGDILI
jgi:methionyl-tRNA formyltransferase